jgi:hypothetical protein
MVLCSLNAVENKILKTSVEDNIFKTLSLYHYPAVNLVLSFSM